MENLDNAINSLSDQQKKYDIALHFTGNDQDKAKRMVSNSYFDLVAVKGSFSSSSLYGAFIIFFNVEYAKVEHTVFVVSPDYQLQSLVIKNDWKSLEKEILNSRTSSAASRINADFSDKFKKGFSLSLGRDFARYLGKSDMTQVTHMIQRFMQESTELKRIEVSVEIQNMSSLQLELESLTSVKISGKLNARKKAEEAEAEQNQPADTDPVAGKDGVRLVILSTVVLSPIKGKYISNVAPGDKIMVSMIETTPQVIEIAKAFNAYDSESKKISSIPARVKSIEYIDGIGYKIFAVIAKGIIAKIIEEETSIKVALDPATVLINEDESDKGGIGIPIIIGLTAAIVMLILFVIVVVL
ncbi:MAG: hypothetical protein JXK07_08410 [Spirochaetes bacterium]|nr:hypothetical protein [Spirochaetota bacterium]MBN2772307.1 hypothetical protein [Spirochaetota bacterium]